MTSVDTEMRPTSALTFPPGFLWGAATAAYQIEGAATEDGRRPSIWDTFSRTPGKVEGGDTGDVACDHYHRTASDVSLMRELGLNAYRFSIAWPRIVPEGAGAVNAAGLDFYSRLVDELLAFGIEPVPTLYHWDLPQALEDRGGWTNPDTARAFADYAGAVFDRIGDRVGRWITLNEPWCSAHLGYVSGDHAPGHRDMGMGLAAGHALMLAHGLAVQRLRAAVPQAQVGISNILSPVYPATDREEDAAAARRWDAYANRWFLDPIYFGDYPKELREAFGDALPAFTDEERRAVTSPINFIGVNYYRHCTIGDDPGGTYLRAKGVERPGFPRTDMDWDINPVGLTEALCWVSQSYGNPVLHITESGAAFHDSPDADGFVEDEKRRAYLEDHLRAAQDAIERGVRLGGYFVWSLMDNFEWAYGYAKRFGIVHVDYATQKRTPKRSAQWYAGCIRRNAV